MVLLGPLIQHGVTLISALTVILSVSVAAPGGLLVLRELARTIDYSARSNVALLSAGRDVDHYKRVLRRSINTAFVFNGLPAARHQRTIGPSSDLDLEFIRLVKSGCGYPGGLCGSIDTDFGFDSYPDATRTMANLARTTMVPARAPINFLLSDDSANPSTYEYLWSTPSIAASSLTSSSHENSADAPSVPSAMLSTEEATRTSTAPSVDCIDFVPLMASGLFLSILVVGTLLAPRSCIDPGSEWLFVPDMSVAVKDGSSCKRDDLRIDPASPLGDSPVDDVPTPGSSTCLPATISQPPVSQVRMDGERFPASELADAGYPSAQTGHCPWWTPE